MQQKISLAFYKSLIISDFLIIRRKYKGSKCLFNSFLQVAVSNYAVCLSFLEVLKSLKQFMSLLLFLKEENNSLFLLYSINKQHRILLKGYFTDVLKVPHMICLQKLQFRLPDNYCIKTQDEDGENWKYIKFFSSFGFIPGRSFFQALQNQILLLFAVNVKSRNLHIGEYKLFNDVLELQKLFFLVLIAKSVLQNK